MKSALLVLLLLIVVGLPATAQCVGLDNSGNNLLLGKYYFRHVIYIVGDNAGDLNRALAVYGNINFAGDGTYTITGSQILDSSGGLTEFFGERNLFYFFDRLRVHQQCCHQQYGLYLRTGGQRDFRRQQYREPERLQRSFHRGAACFARAFERHLSGTLLGCLHEFSGRHGPKQL